QGIALALERPVVGISTLAALALEALHGDAAASGVPGQEVDAHAPAGARAAAAAAGASGAARIVAAIDARMGEVYVGQFVRSADGLVEASGPEQLAPPQSVLIPEGPWTGV